MPEKLNVNELYKVCDPDIFTFHTTNDLPDLKETIGQERALHAIDFGLSLDSAGFNIFILGENGTGKMTTIMSLLNEKAAQESAPVTGAMSIILKTPMYPLRFPSRPGKALCFRRKWMSLSRF